MKNKNRNKTIKKIKQTITKIKLIKNKSNNKYLNKYNKIIKINYNFHIVNNLKNKQELKVNILEKRKRK
jgi:hypothetical protein